MSSLIINIILLGSFLMFFAFTALSFSTTDTLQAFPNAPMLVIAALFTSLFLFVNSDHHR